MIYEVDVTGGLSHQSISEVSYNRIGQLVYLDVDFVDFFLNKEQHYGLFLNKDWLFVYFEFDPLARWD